MREDVYAVFTKSRHVLTERRVSRHLRNIILVLIGRELALVYQTIEQRLDTI